MSLIIKNKIQELMQGYPTISDKYDVAPAVLEGDTAVMAGAPVTLGSTAGRYKACATAADVVAGFILATNVKLPNTYPASTQEQTYVSGDAFNLMIKGFLAVPVDSSATADNIANGKKVALLADGKITTSGTASATDIPGAYFTGCKETVRGVLLAEIAFNI